MILVLLLACGGGPEAAFRTELRALGDEVRATRPIPLTLGRSLADPWGHAVSYEVVDPKEGVFRLVSRGSDGEPGGDDIALRCKASGCSFE